MPSRPSPTSANVAGSAAVTPKRNRAITRVRLRASAAPIATPIQESFSPSSCNQPENVSTLRAQRDADADLMRALGDEVRHRTVNADCRQQQGYDRKDLQQAGVEFAHRRLTVRGIVPSS